MRSNWGGPEAGKSNEDVYLFAVSVGVAVVGVESAPGRYGEQHVPPGRCVVLGCRVQPRLTSAAREVELGISEQLSGVCERLVYCALWSACVCVCVCV